LSGQQPVAVKLQDLGFSDSCRVRDLWKKTNLGTYKGVFSAIINQHGAGLYRISPK
jgi:hypothetical protein